MSQRARHVLAREDTIRPAGQLGPHHRELKQQGRGGCCSRTITRGGGESTEAAITSTESGLSDVQRAEDQSASANPDPHSDPGCAKLQQGFGKRAGYDHAEQDMYRCGGVAGDVPHHMRVPLPIM